MRLSKAFLYALAAAFWVAFGTWLTGFGAAAALATGAATTVGGLLYLRSPRKTRAA